MQAKQEWAPGQRVKVGFMTLNVIRKVATPGDFRPDVWHLVNDKGAKYTFQPHWGLSKGHHEGE